ncbi:hypothetical protein [Crocosphaera sp.]|uniref:hypothetical protein n=1 Tax=Crocosphaera sp. TaxID=2729996 RepID=UPI0026371496|nr:hypothetical protein [Crocosphaera sp.]MDJ0582920.1 hypothetical protein [Crocosphaera sp.]
MATIFHYNPIQQLDRNSNNLIDQAEAAGQPIFTPTLKEESTDYILDISNRNGIINFTNTDTKNFFLPNNTGDFKSGDYMILALRGQGNIEVLPENLAEITKFNGIGTLISEQKYVLRSYGDNQWTLDTFGGGGGGAKSEIVQPSVGTTTDLSGYVSDGDTNGIFYYLGTDGNTTPYSNPQSSNKITVSTNTTLTSPLNLSSRSTSSSIFQAAEGNYIQIEIKEDKIVSPSLIKIEVNTKRLLSVEASMNGIVWFPLLNEESSQEDNYHWRSLTPTFNQGHYRYFRIIDKSTEGGTFFIRNIEFYGTLAENYEYEIKGKDKGQILFFSNSDPRILTVSNDLPYSNGDYVYLSLNHHTIEVQGNVTNLSGTELKLVGLGKLYQLIKTSNTWGILLLNSEVFGQGEINEEILNEDKILTIADKQRQMLDPNGADKKIQLPPYTPGFKKDIINNSDGEYGLVIEEIQGENSVNTLLRLDQKTEKAAEIEASVSTENWLIKTYGSY